MFAAFLPPTLLTSIYGMHFKGRFPKLDWALAIRFTLLLMLSSATA